MAVALTEILVGDDPASWKDAGFSVDGDRIRIGSVTIRLTGVGDGPDARRGVLGWSLTGLTGWSAGLLDGLPTTSKPPTEADSIPESHAHPNRAQAIDHVVVTSPDLGRTIGVLEAHGLEVRRVRDVGPPDAPRQQVFFWIGEPILELVGPTTPIGDGPSRIFGLAITTDDIDATAAELGDRVGRVKDAVQPGRRITTLRHRDLDISVPIAFMSPHTRPADA